MIFKFISQADILGFLKSRLECETFVRSVKWLIGASLYSKLLTIGNFVAWLTNFTKCTTKSSECHYKTVHLNDQFAIDIIVL